VLFGVFMVCVLELGITLLALLLLGARIHFASRIVGVLLAAAVVFAAGRIAVWIWGSSGAFLAAQILVFAVTVSVVLARPVWNPVGQVFFGGYVAAALAYLAFAGGVTFAGGLSPIASLASAALLVLEATALFLTASFAFETCDVICRTRHSRDFPEPDPGYLPLVSLQIPAYNEPPEMLIETIKTAEAIDYPNFEIVVIDNNTEDPETWRPVEEYCRDRPNVTFAHVDGLDGYKSGALNLAMRELTDPRAEIIGILDSDYLVDPRWLRETVGYFADESVAFVQTPQDYREWKGNPYFTACYDAYRYFFTTSMPSRNERNSIIFAGTMGLLRRSAIESLGGWDEWTITEDAEASLRMLRAGWSGMFVARSFGRGIMPLTFSALKSQRYRWCFGGMQILRKHWRTLMPWDRSPANRLSTAQRLDYLVSGLQWLNDLVYLCFAIVLLVIGGFLIAGSHVPIRPFVGPTILLPVMLLASGLIRAIWALHVRERISYRRSFLAFLNWLSLSLTVARACAEGLVRREGAFLRTPKTGRAHRLRAALVAARGETLAALALLGVGVGLLAHSHATAFVTALVLWQALLYLSAPMMSWLNQRAELTPELEQRRRTEERRERLARVARRVQIGSAVALAGAGAAFVVVLALGAAHPGNPTNPLRVPNASPSPPSKSKAKQPASPAVTTSGSTRTAATTTAATTTAPTTTATTATTTEATDTTTTDTTATDTTETTDTTATVDTTAVDTTTVDTTTTGP
jgi:cellulose synthase/poly-beta-1,6-N-acetylglucosamine synthase-like glycosyltransferase